MSGGDYPRGPHRSAYESWRLMRRRCDDPKDRNYSLYGGRGVRVCARWETFALFLQDMGLRPKGTSLDRLDPNGDYEPGNCRWATLKQQARNMRTNILVMYMGRKMPLVEAAEIAGVRYKRVWQRVRKQGWSLERALTQPPRVVSMPGQKP